MSSDFDKRVADKAYHLKKQKARRRREKINAMAPSYWADLIALVLLVGAILTAFAYL